MAKQGEMGARVKTRAKSQTTRMPALLISTAAANIEHKAGYEDISSAFILPLWPHTCLTDIPFDISTRINEYQPKYYYHYLI